MSKFTLSMAAVVAMSTFAIAGGDIAPVEPVAEVVAPAPVVDRGFYVGIAYSLAYFSGEYVDEHSNDSWEGDYTEDHDAGMLQVGYKINKYFAVEGRYWTSFGDADWTEEVRDGSTNSWKNEGTDPNAEGTAWGLYVKPMYPVTEALDVYALLGYGNVTISDSTGDWFDEDDFQWGLGASYDLTDNFSLFADYIRMSSGEGMHEFTDQGGSGEPWETGVGDTETYTVNFGLTYKF